MSNFRKKVNKTYSKKHIQSKSNFVENILEKQMLVDLEKRISLHVGNFLVLTEEGTPAQIALAHQKAKSEFLKFGPEMSKIACCIGGDLPYIVSEFLESIDTVLHCNGFLDEEKISHCFCTTQRLITELRI